MALGKYLLAAAAASLSLSPAVAAGNPASSLSVAKSVRAGSKAGKGSQVAGLTGPIIFALAAVAAVTVAIIVVEDDDSDSN